MDLAQIELVLLDRDGVINHDSADYIKSPQEWKPLAGAIDAIVSIQNKAHVAVCTNQSGVGRGYFSESTLGAIHDKLNLCIIEAGGQPVNIFYCPHHPEDGCACRKPKPELLLTAMRAFDTQPSKTLYIGDSEKDLLAARNAGCVDVLALTGNGANTALSDVGKTATISCFDLSEFAHNFVHAQ